MTHNLIEACWRPIPSCPGYGASDDGRVRNDGRGTLLGGTDDRYGYRYVNIMVGDERVKRKVHRLVCEAFHGPCPSDRECGHLDGNKSNNRPENLAWITRSENTRQQILHGTFAGCANLRPGNPAAALRPDQIAAIRKGASEGMGGRRLARKHGIARSTAYRAVYGRKPEGQTPNHPSQSEGEYPVNGNSDVK